MLYYILVKSEDMTTYGGGAIQEVAVARVVSDLSADYWNYFNCV